MSFSHFPSSVIKQIQDEYKKLGKECKAQLRADRQHWADEKPKRE